MYSVNLPVSFIAHNNEFLFSYKEDCVAVGNYSDGEFLLFETETPQKFANAMMAFSHLNAKFRSSNINR